ncbi:MAG TPA: S8 family serine peptidase [Polyangiaceae bacterium]|nr:S8 family serine peptidase [Polyangiaceae bacterium]
MSQRESRLAVVHAVALLAFGTAAHADVSIAMLARAETVSGIHAGTPTSVLGRPELTALVELPDGADATGVQRLSSHFGVARAPLADLDALSAAHRDWHMTWSTPLHPLLDRAAVWTGAPTFRNATGLAGKGAIIGIIDTGADVTHPDLQNADGTTRIAYFIDYSKGPAGKQKDAESHCSTAVPCAVYSNTDLDALVKAGTAKTALSKDVVGHGTHVTSLAAGNGGAEKKYVGMAPEATIIVARALDSSGQISDATVLSAASLIFELATQLGKPAVLNLSLGSDFGPHDGSSSLEKGLADLIADQPEGRAVVVAAGNSAGLFEGEIGYPSPLGVHTDISVQPGSRVEVPVLTPPPQGAGDTLSGTIFVWATFRPGDDVGVGVERPNSELAPIQRKGQVATFGVDKVLTATIAVQALSEVQDLGVPDENAAAIIIDGTWPKSETFSLAFEGSGTVSLWVNAVGEIGSESGGIGALFPESTKESTVTIPACHPDLIAVGATLNRTRWNDRLGAAVAITSFGGVDDPPLDSIGFFSSAGPTTDLRMKPDIVAPGAFVIGAMSADADPRKSAASIFGETGTCTPPTDCAVIDAQHAVTVGTSMAAPIVSGAVALLFEQNPKLTARGALTLLQAGARHPQGIVPYQAQLGAGALDLPGTLDVENAEANPVVREPAATNSFLSLGASYAHPDPTWTVPALLKLRSADGHAADGFDPKNLSVDVTSGSMVGELTRAAPGFYRLGVAAARDTGGAELGVTVRYAGHVLAAESIPIAVDISTARGGFSARGGCNVARGEAPATSLTVAALALIALRGRRYSRAARTARNQGRTGTSGRARRR